MIAETGQAVEARRDVGVVRSERVLPDRQCALVERLRFGVTAFDMVECCQYGAPVFR